MKELTAAEARRLALDAGAELEVDGVRFNTGRAEAPMERPRPAPPPAPEPAPEPAEPAPMPVEAVTINQVEQLLAERDRQWEQRLDSVVEALKVALVAVATRPAPEPAAAPVQHWDFDVTYDRNGAITKVRADAS